MTSVLHRVGAGLLALGRKLTALYTIILLAVIYFVVVTPIGLVRRLLGGDPLERRFDKSLPSYWHDHDERDADHFRRPY